MKQLFKVVYKQAETGEWRYHIVSGEGVLLRKPIKSLDVLFKRIENLKRDGWQWEGEQEG